MNDSFLPCPGTLLRTRTDWQGWYRSDKHKTISTIRNILTGSLLMIVEDYAGRRRSNNQAIVAVMTEDGNIIDQIVIDKDELLI